MADNDKKTEKGRQGGLAVKERPKVARPKMYKVLIHNDDFTTMEFVVWILMTVFHKDEADSARVMLHVHRTGLGVAGVYTREIAETKCKKVTALARKHEFPLQCTSEEA